MGQGLKRRRRGAWWALVATVALAHWLLPREIANWAPRWDGHSGMPERFALEGLTELRATVIRAPAPGPRSTPAGGSSAAAPHRPAAATAPAPAPAPEPAASAPELAASAAAATAPDQAASAALAASAPMPVQMAEVSASAPIPGRGASAPAEAAANAPAASVTTLIASSASPSTAPGAPATAPYPGLGPGDDATPGFSWPAATRLRYNLTGFYRREVRGQAKVDWAKRGDRYQINLDVGVNVALIELFSRRMTSEGRITAQGLAPERYDEETRIAMRVPQRSGVRIEGGQVLLANGQREIAQAGLQDTVSQFVQLSWLFGNPEALRSGPPAPGTSFELPLALPNNFSVWVFDVQAPEVLKTPFGDIDVIRVVPRRKPALGRSVLLAETWLAPGYRYLPVRIRITEGTADGQPQSETYLDLTITRPPLLAEDIAQSP
jgi:hypothetical protein